MKRILTPGLLLLTASSPVFAGQCEDNFVKKGNTFTGAEYSSSLKVPGLSIANAVGQMRNLAIADGMDVLDESVESGSLLLEKPENLAHKTLPIHVTAKADGGATDVAMVMKTRRGAFASAESIKRAMCNMLAQLKAGKGPVARTATAQKPIDMLATALASQVERQAEDNAAAIPARYKGKVYSLKGRNQGVRGENGHYTVSFDRKPGESELTKSMFETQVICVLAANQNAYAMTLQQNDRLQLTGTFDRYDSSNRVVVLKECRPSK